MFYRINTIWVLVWVRMNKITKNTKS